MFNIEDMDEQAEIDYVNNIPDFEWPDSQSHMDCKYFKGTIGIPGCASGGNCTKPYNNSDGLCDKE